MAYMIYYYKKAKPVKTNIGIYEDYGSTKAKLRQLEDKYPKVKFYFKKVSYATR